MPMGGWYYWQGQLSYQWTVQALDSGGKVLGTAQAVAKFPP